MQTRHPTVLGGRYALELELGRSGTGMVWRAEDRLLDRTVTVKLVHPSLGDDPAFLRRLDEEARRVASLAAPGVARLLDSGQEDGVPFLVREHLDGVSARSMLEGRGPLEPADAARIALAVLEALAPAHAAGVLHLHLQIDDVLLGPDGAVRITDLGIGSAVTATRPPPESARLLGGSGLAPEQSTTGAVDQRTDVFAVGAMLFELLTGQGPAGRRSPREIRPQVPRPLDRVVARALAPQPDERFDDVLAFATALRETADQTGAGPPMPRGAGLGAWLAVPVAVALVGAAVIGAGLWLGRLEVGGPLGIRPAQDEAQGQTADGSTTLLRPQSVSVLDPPPGDGSENDSNAPLAVDGDASTAWRSENYFDGTLHKPGVGLVFDLGRSRSVLGFRLSTPHPGFLFSIAVGDDPDTLVDRVGDPLTAQEDTRGDLEATGRYVLVWVTTVVEVEDGHRAEIGEFEVVVGSDA